MIFFYKTQSQIDIFPLKLNCSTLCKPVQNEERERKRESERMEWEIINTDSSVPVLGTVDWLVLNWKLQVNDHTGQRFQGSEYESDIMKDFNIQGFRSSKIPHLSCLPLLFNIRLICEISIWLHAKIQNVLVKECVTVKIYVGDIWALFLRANMVFTGILKLWTVGSKFDVTSGPEWLYGLRLFVFCFVCLWTMLHHWAYSWLCT